MHSLARGEPSFRAATLPNHVYRGVPRPTGLGRHLAVWRGSSAGASFGVQEEADSVWPPRLDAGWPDRELCKPTHNEAPESREDLLDHKKEPAPDSPNLERQMILRYGRDNHRCRARRLDSETVGAPRGRACRPLDLIGTVEEVAEAREQGATFRVFLRDHPGPTLTRTFPPPW